jgi:pectate lyase
MLLRSFPLYIGSFFSMVLFDPLFAESRIPAFPGAEGFGAYAQGGRGGVVLFVANLKDYNPETEEPIPGSLRVACEAEEPRIVVFRVSGTIELKAALNIVEPYITLAGQTAPGDGICIKNYGVSISTHDVVIRYLRFRPGDQVGRKLAQEGKTWDTDALTITSPSRNVILDHCSASWANDEVCSVSGAGITDVTVQWCIISESLNQSTHVKGAHGYGSLIRCNGNVSFHHNLYAFHSSRSPRPGTYGEGSILFDFRNNLMHIGGSGYSAGDPVRMNFVANYHPTTPFTASVTCEYFSDVNVGEISGGQKREQLFEVAPIKTDRAEEARDAILNFCGAVLPKRDAVDTRVIGLVRADTGHLIDSADEVGGWPKLESVSPPEDTDSDGMPDQWEKKHGLYLERADNNGDLDEDGYTHIEEFLNGTDPRQEDSGQQNVTH